MSLDPRSPFDSTASNGRCHCGNIRPLIEAGKFSSVRAAETHSGATSKLPPFLVVRQPHEVLYTLKDSAGFHGDPTGVWHGVSRSKRGQDFGLDSLHQGGW